MASDDRDSRALLAALVATRGPDPQRRRHNWNATLARLDEDPLAGAPAPPHASASRTWMLAAAALVLFATALFGGRALLAPEPVSPRSQASASDATPAPPQIAPERAPLPTKVPAPTRHEPAATSAEPVPIEPPPPVPRRPRSRPVEASAEIPAVAVVTPERLALETRLIARARAAATAHDDATAITLLQEHGREFPDGAMVEDRRAWLAIVQCRSHAAAGQRSAATFLAAHPRSPYAERVRTACEIE